MSVSGREDGKLKCNVPKCRPNRGQLSPHVLKSQTRLAEAPAEVRGELGTDHRGNRAPRE